MKSLYWRPHSVSRIELVLVALLAVLGLMAVEQLESTTQLPHHADKVKAATLARRAFSAIQAERLQRGHEFDPESDPAETGMIGQLISPATSNSGNLAAKQASINPNFAAVVVGWLKKVGVGEGDVVAVGVSGSFPGFNVAVYAALEALGAKPIVISSASSSQWGANVPGLLWLDMERVLRERRVFTIKSVAASRGGIEDRAKGVAEADLEVLDETIATNEVRRLRVKSYADSVEKRMATYDLEAGSATIKAYINVGGGTASVGTRVGKRLFRPGLNQTAPRGVKKIDAVMSRFILSGVPVVHLVRVAQLAERYGFSTRPRARHRVGEGKIYSRTGYNRWLAGVVAGVLLLLLVAVVRTDWGFRLLRIGRGGNRKPPEQMV